MQSDSDLLQDRADGSHAEDGRSGQDGDDGDDGDNGRADADAEHAWEVFLQAEGALSRDIRADVLSVGDICIHLHELY